MLLKYSFYSAIYQLPIRIQLDLYHHKCASIVRNCKNSSMHLLKKPLAIKRAVCVNCFIDDEVLEIIAHVIL